MRTAVRLLMALLTTVLLAACTAGTAPPTTIDLRVTQDPAETRTVEVPLHSEVTINVTSDIADELHVHGYELERQLEPGGSTQVAFRADMSGAYEVETHSNDTVWLKLVVK